MEKPLNPTLELLLNRRSVRKFSAQPLSEAEKNAILQAAMRAPTAGNMMLYAIIDVDDQALKDRLVETCDHQPFIATAPLVLVFLADYQRWYDYYQFCQAEAKATELGATPRLPQEGDLLLACCDALIAAQSAVVAAESLGIGSCYIGDVLENYETHRDMFNLPPYAIPVGMLVFGRPAAGEMPAGRTPRFAPEFIVHHNHYRRFAPQEFERMFAHLQERLMASPQRNPAIENVGQANYLRKFTAEFSIEMSRSVRAMLKSWSE